MGCPTPSLHLHSSIGKQGQATSGCHPNPTSLVLLVFSFSALDRTDGVVVWQETGQKGRTGEEAQRGPVGFFQIFPREEPDGTMMVITLLMTMNGGKREARRRVW